MRTPRTLLCLSLALTCALALSGIARGAVAKQPGWRVVAAIGPANLPPKQSEVKQVTVIAEGGTFTLSLASPAQTTAPIAYDASPQEVQEAIEALPYFGAGSVSVSGGPGGNVEDPYLLAFTGSQSEQNVPELTAGAASLSGPSPYAGVSTTVEGGPGTGEIGIIPANVGGAATSGPITLHLGQLPVGITISGEPVSRGGHWTCTIEGTASEVTCTTEEPVEALTPAPQLEVPVEVQSPAVSSGQVTVEISGGGAAAGDSYDVPLTVSAQRPEAGFASFFSEAFDANGQPSTQAGGHPYAQVTLFQLNTARSGRGRLIPAGDVRDLNVDLPPGFAGDPLVTPRCPQGLLISEGTGEPASACFDPDYTIGTIFPGIKNFGAIQSSAAFPIYNDVPVGGSAAQFSTRLVAVAASLIARLRTEEDFGIRVSSPNSNTLTERTYAIYTRLFGEPASAGGKAFFRNPTDCAEEAREAPVARISASSWQHPETFHGASESVPAVTGCNKLSFKPDFTFQPTSNLGSSVAGATAHLHIDQSGLTDPAKLATPDIKRSVVKLPRGFDINAAQADGLEACTEGQVGYVGAGALPNPTRFNDDPVTCPDASKLGTAEVTSPPLEEPLKGTIYLASQEANPFDSLLGIYLVFESPRFGVTLKLAGKVEPNEATGQLSATFDYLPQQPVEDLTLHFRGGGPRSEFATPEVCGTYTTSGSWEPWSAPESGPDAATEDSFTVAGGCSASEATRSFAPSFEAGTVNPLAGAYSPLVIKVGRKDGEQELKRLDFSLPQGLVGKLAGIPYCPESAIAAATAKSGREEQASPSCPGASKLGTVDSAAGAGPEPVHVGGNLYLAGPYEGAPLSVVVIVPAVSGPFDLGDVVVRNPLRLDEETAQVTATSDPIPTMLRGIPVKLRSVAIYMNRPQFTLNPTSCEATRVSAALHSSDGATATPSTHFQVGGCGALAFKPKLSIRLKGATRRGGHPALRVALAPRAGDANIGSLSVAMPHSEFLAQGHIRTICTRVQFAAGAGGGGECPPGSVYGHVSATSPLLGYPLEGPLILRSSDHELPDLVAVVRGPASQPVVIAQVGRIDSIHGGIRTSFETVPDAPISRVLVTMPAGRKSLLENSTNICRRTHRANIRFGAHNGLLRSFKAPVKAAGCRKAKKHHRGHHRHKRS